MNLATFFCADGHWAPRARLDTTLQIGINIFQTTNANRFAMRRNHQGWLSIYQTLLGIVHIRLSKESINRHPLVNKWYENSYFQSHKKFLLYFSNITNFYQNHMRIGELLLIETFGACLKLTSFDFGRFLQFCYDPTLRFMTGAAVIL